MLADLDGGRLLLGRLLSLRLGCWLWRLRLRGRRRLRAVPRRRLRPSRLLLPCGLHVHGHRCVSTAAGARLCRLGLCQMACLLVYNYVASRRRAQKTGPHLGKHSRRMSVLP
jgi:hypothetical protein